MSEPQFQEDALGKAYDSRLMKRLLSYVRPYLWHTVAGALSLLIIGALQISLIALVQRAIDDHISEKDFDGLLNISLIYVGIMALKFGLEYFQVLITARMGQEVQQDIRMQVFSKLQGMDLKFFDRNPVGRLVTRVTNDVNVLNELFSSGVINIVGDIVMLVGFVSLMLYYDWQLSLAVFAILPLLGVATVIFRRKVRVIYRELRLTVARINAFVSERISGMQVIKLFAKEDQTFAEFDRRNSQALDQNLKQVFYYAIFFPIVELIGAFSLATLVVYGGYQISQETLTFGELTAFILLIERFYRPIRDLSEKYNLLQASMASSERIFQLLDTEPDQLVEKTVIEPLANSTTFTSGPTASGKSESPASRGAITFSNVTFAYNDDDYVLNDVSFEIKPGEKVAIVGATGAGKTSLISLLFRFYDYQSGTITLDGKDLREYDLRVLRNHLGLVLQDVQIFSGTLADNVRLGESAIDDERVRWAMREVGFHRAMGLADISELNINSEVKERGATLSTGQKQLLSFARALAFDPAILTLDEATSSVDTASERLIQEALERIMSKRTSVVVAHRLSTIEKADKILVLHQGKLREVGKHAELLAKSGIYYKLYQMQYASERAGADNRVA